MPTTTHDAYCSPPCTMCMAASRPSPRRTAIPVDGALDEVHELTHHKQFELLPAEPVTEAAHSGASRRSREPSSGSPPIVSRCPAAPPTQPGPRLSELRINHINFACSEWPTSRAASTRSLAGPTPKLRMPALAPVLDSPQAHTPARRARAHAACCASKIVLLSPRDDYMEDRETQGCFCKYKHSRLLTVLATSDLKTKRRGIDRW